MRHELPEMAGEVANTVLLWFRRDLRLTDNPALTAALAAAAHVLPVYIHSPDEEAPWVAGAASRWWLHHSLISLDQQLRSRGAGLIVRRGPTRETLLELVRATGARAIHFNRLYEPVVRERDARVASELQRAGIAVSSHNSALLFEPAEIASQQDAPYRVFTPFWRACSARLAERLTVHKAPGRWNMATASVASLEIGDLGLLPAIQWDSGFYERWSPGEPGALLSLQHLLDERLDRYATARDRPDITGSSRLSPHLHYGEVGPRQVAAAILSASVFQANGATEQSALTFLRELGWREFAHHLLHHFPQTTERPLDRRFEHFRWVADPASLHAWQRGRTGVPLVDAGMRELWHTGWMHNRVRMIVASFLTKNLRVHWLEGARWFFDTLVDADLANNTLGWQWTAGCGADAAPFTRIFNPVLQAERFDPKRAYIRRWLPELARLPDDYIHRPWEAPPDELELAGVRLGESYPLPIIDLAASRRSALAAYDALRA